MDRVEKERLFGREYRRLFDRLYRHVRVRMHSLQDAEDLVSDVVLSGFRTLENYDPEKGNLEQWLMGIARFKLIAYWKKGLPAIDLEAIEEIVADETDDIRALDLGLAWEKVMERVPEQLHPLFVMRFSEGMSYDEIAEVTGKSPAALRQTFSRLLKRLRVELPDMDV